MSGFNLDQYKMPYKEAPVRLALGRSTFFMLSAHDKAGFPDNVIRVPVGRCKSVTLQKQRARMTFDFTGTTPDDVAVMQRKLAYLCSTDDSLGLVVERVKGKTALVAMLLSDAAAADAVSAFEEIDEDAEDEPLAYMTRDRATGEEYVMFDPPGGTFRDLGDEYQKSEDTGIRLRDRRNGVWKNGDCFAFNPDDEVREVIKATIEGANSRVLKVPRLDRTQVFPDGYEIIEEGSEDGWLVWQWCLANCSDDWWWVNLDGNGPWLEVKSMQDFIGVTSAFGTLRELNPALFD